jgi:hypothetical protein
MLGEMPISALADWSRYAEREPFGPASWDARIGYVLAVLVQAITGQATKPDDYTPRWGGQEPKRQDWRAMRSIVKEWKRANNRKN